MDVGTVQNPVVNITLPGQKAGTPQVTQPQIAQSQEAQLQSIQLQVVPDVKASSKINQTTGQETKASVFADHSQANEKKTVENTVASLNQFMDLMSADIHFQVDQKTSRLIVQVVSAKDQTVLRQYPSKEFLEMIANIREFIGVFTDKKA